MRGPGIGRGGGEIAAHREEHLAAPVQHRFYRTNGVEAVLARRLEAEYLLQPVQECRRWPLEDAHRAIALHVLWPRTGQAPAPGRPRLPRSSSRLTSIWIVATECLCWVMPMPQQQITLPAAM